MSIVYNRTTVYTEVSGFAKAGEEVHVSSEVTITDKELLEEKDFWIAMEGEWSAVRSKSKWSEGKGIAWNWHWHFDAPDKAGKRAQVILYFGKQRVETGRWLEISQPAPVLYSLTVNSVPTGVKIKLDGLLPKVTTPYTFKVTKGMHSISSETVGYKDYLETFELVSDMTKTITLVPTELPPEIPPVVTPPKIVGKVVVAVLKQPIALAKIKFSDKTTTAGLDGKYELTGFTPISGPITCSFTGFETQTKYITAPETGTMTVDFELVSVLAPDFESFMNLIKTGETNIEKYGLFGALFKSFDEMLTSALKKIGLEWVTEPKVTLDIDAILKWIFFSPLMVTSKTGIVSIDATKVLEGVTPSLFLKKPAETIAWYIKQDSPTQMALITKWKGMTGGPQAISSLISGAIKSQTEKGLTVLGVKLVISPKTILWGVSGILGIMGMAYGISFGVEWFAKEGLTEMFTIPISDRMRSWRVTKDPALKTTIEASIKKLEESIPKAEGLIKSVAWLWPFTKDEWYAYIDGVKFELEQVKKELAEEVVVKLPEEIRAFIRDITDGDTIEMDLNAYDNKTGNTIKLPEYGKTGHAVVRMVGINAPEKSPKGEILCTDIAVYKVEKEFADTSRDVLLPLNDKQVILYIDPAKTVDTYGRLLAKVMYAGEDIGLSQLKRGLACWYFREKHKYIDDNLYKKETLHAMEEKIGMWAVLPEQPVPPIVPEVPVVVPKVIMFTINSIPERAQVWIDEVYTHHTTPTNEIEQKKEMYLWTEGAHRIRVLKGGYSAEADIELIAGERLTLTLELAGMATPVPVEPPVTPRPEAKLITARELYDMLGTYVVDRKRLTGKEWREFKLNYRWEEETAINMAIEVEVYTEGRKVLTNSEWLELGTKFGF